MDQKQSQTLMKNSFPKDNFSVNTVYDPTKCVGEYKEFIGIYRNFLPKPNCDMIIDYFERQTSYWHEDTQFTNRSLGRYDTALDINNIPWEGDDDQVPIVREFLNKAFEEYSSVFSGADVPQYYTTLKMQKTPPGGGYHVWHCENTGVDACERCLVWILYLNDVYDGGETEFLYQSKRVQPTAGTINVWPAGFTHQHRGNPPLSGDKYILTGWTYYHPNS